MALESIHDIEELCSLNRSSRGTFKSTGFRPGFRQRSGLLIALAFPLLLCLSLVIGFGFFVNSLSSKEPTNVLAADAIVALTGGSDRISDAVDILAEGRAKRLLISGVNLATSLDRLAQINSRHSNFFSCCIDIDYAARNTVGNAIETRRWVEERGIRSLIIVTSNYHMPRAMIELKRAMPNVKLISYPSVAERATDDTPLRMFSNIKIISLEYGKFLIAYARAAFVPKLDMTAATLPIVGPEFTGSLRRSGFHADRNRPISSVLY